MTQAQDKLQAEQRVSGKQYSGLSTNHISEQVTVLQAELEKTQGKLAIAQNKN